MTTKPIPYNLFMGPRYFRQPKRGLCLYYNLSDHF